jgi:hypothetical protein
VLLVVVELVDDPPPRPALPMLIAPEASAPTVPAARPPPPPATAPTIGVTNRMRAGMANKAMIIRASPVTVARSAEPKSLPSPAFPKILVPLSWKAVA